MIDRRIPQLRCYVLWAAYPPENPAPKSRRRVSAGLRLIGRVLANSTHPAGSLPYHQKLIDTGAATPGAWVMGMDLAKRNKSLFANTEKRFTFPSPGHTPRIFTAPQWHTTLSSWVILICFCVPQNRQIRKHQKACASFFAYISESPYPTHSSSHPFNPQGCS